jgi:hypothetical protein
MATAPVCMGAALGLVAVAWVREASLEAELLALEAELVSDAIADVSESRSDPVAVDSSDDSDDSWLLTSLVIEDRAELSAELMELWIEDAREDTDEAEAADELSTVVVVVDTWAATRGARARTTAAKRILAVVCGIVVLG